MDAVVGIAVTIVLGLIALAAVIFLGGAIVSGWSAARNGPRASGPAIITRGDDVYVRVDPSRAPAQNRGSDLVAPDEADDELAYLDDLDDLGGWPPEPLPR